ncbi:hypothetical protein E2C01_079810 [Portunus trituberculatus]|uniref:Uncharacterized protein n=1 Tax=Portunus trituberculatus TaxID=210409 RepID=A0A5B7IMG3_PORTR|nr:hypothetical protein [Portunus trituberculatus]
MFVERKSILKILTLLTPISCPSMTRGTENLKHPINMTAPSPLALLWGRTLCYGTACGVSSPALPYTYTLLVQCGEGDVC